MAVVLELEEVDCVHIVARVWWWRRSSRRLNACETMMRR
jgi:hypothetical protein